MWAIGFVQRTDVEEIWCNRPQWFDFNIYDQLMTLSCDQSSQEFSTQNGRPREKNMIETDFKSLQGALQPHIMGLDIVL